MYIHHYHLQSSQNTQLIYYCQLLTVVVINNLHLIKSFYQNWFSWSTFIFPRKGIKINLFSLGLYYWVNTARNKKDKHVRETPKRRQCRKKQLCSKVDYILFLLLLLFERKQNDWRLVVNIILQWCFGAQRRCSPSPQPPVASLLGKAEVQKVWPESLGTIHEIFCWKCTGFYWYSAFHWPSSSRAAVSFTCFSHAASVHTAWNLGATVYFRYQTGY